MFEDGKNGLFGVVMLNDFVEIIKTDVVNCDISMDIEICLLGLNELCVLVGGLEVWKVHWNKFSRKILFV